MKTEVAIALTSYLFDSPTPISNKMWIEVRKALQHDDDPATLLEWASANLLPGDAEYLGQRLVLLPQVSEELDRLSRTGIRAVSEFDGDYPRKFHEVLGDKRPAVLFYGGDAALFNRESIGIVGSRNVDESGAEFAASVASFASKEGFLVVSGGAKGVDQISMNAAHESGGRSLGFLSDSLTRYAKSSRALLDEGEVCLATPYSPDAGFSVGNAMGRNKLIYAHSLATVVVSSDLGTGGTWAGAKEAIEKHFSRVIVRIGDGVPDGNKALVKMGGIPIENPSDLLDAINASPSNSLF